MIFSIDMYFMMISILAGVTVYFQPNSPMHLKLFPLFLLLTFNLEFIAGYMVSHEMHTTILYNFFNIIQFGFFIYFSSNILFDIKAISRGKVLLGSYLIFAVLNICFFQKIKTYNSITYAIGCLCVVTLCVYYFYELFRLKKFVKLTHEPSFWITTGLLFYFSCSFPLLTTANFVQNIPEIIINSLQSLIQLMNILLYSLFTIAFLCRIKIRKYILSL